MTVSQRMLGLLGGVALLSATGCAHFQTAPRALYAGPAQPTERTAVLTGYLAKVDDVDVSQMTGPFAVLPGCHVVTNTTNVGNDSPSGGWSMVTPKLTFALRMQAGRSYAIEAQHAGGGSETTGLKMHAVERDGAGTKLADIPPSRNKADLEACQAWAAELEAGSKPAP
jgi:hypothetical protein